MTSNEQRDPATMTEAEQMEENYRRQQEVAARKPVPHRPDAGTEQGWTNATAEQRAHNEKHNVPNPLEVGGQGDTVTGSTGGTATPAKRGAPKAGA